MMKKKCFLLCVALVLIISAFTGCSQQQTDVNTDIDKEVSNGVTDVYPMVISDGLGHTVTIESKPERVISISPSQTEILYALGLENKLVAVSDFCDYPVEAMDKEKVGSSWATSTERIIELDPDIVFVYGEGQPEAVSQLTEAGITIIRYMPETIGEIYENILVTGQIFSVEDQANLVIDEMNERKNAIVEKVKDQPSKRVFYQVWDEPLRTAGKGSYIDELITLAGGENITSEAGWPMYSVEALVEEDPEVYLVPAHMGEVTHLTAEEEQELIDSIKVRPGYSNINAVINNQIVPLDPNIVSRPGTRVIEALEMIAKGIHPDLF